MYLTSATVNGTLFCELKISMFCSSIVVRNAKVFGVDKFSMEWQGGGIMNCKFQPHKAHVPYLLQLLVPFSTLICCFLRQSFSRLLIMIGYLTPCASHRLKLRLGYAFVSWFLGSQTSQILPASQWLDCCWLDVFKFDCVLPHLIGYGFTFFTLVFSGILVVGHTDVWRWKQGKQQMRNCAVCTLRMMLNRWKQWAARAMVSISAKHWQVLMIQSSSTTVPPSRPFWLLDQSFEVVIHPCVFLSVGHCFSHLLRLFTVTKSWNLGILLWK